MRDLNSISCRSTAALSLDTCFGDSAFRAMTNPLRSKKKRAVSISSATAAATLAPRLDVAPPDAVVAIACRRKVPIRRNAICIRDDPDRSFVWRNVPKPSFLEYSIVVELGSFQEMLQDVQPCM